jgi:hypothetical protein
MTAGEFYKITSISGNKISGKYFELRDDQVWLSRKEISTFIDLDNIAKIQKEPDGGPIFVWSVIIGIIIISVVVYATQPFTINFSM